MCIYTYPAPNYGNFMRIGNKSVKFFSCIEDFSGNSFSCIEDFSIFRDSAHSSRLIAHCS